MERGSDPEAAEVFDFLDQYLDDVEHGRRRPLSHYLARFPRCEDAIAREYLRAAAASDGGDAAPRADDAPATSIGPYRLIREIGRGGQGSVYLAEDTRLARLAAVKVLASRFDAVRGERIERFRREAAVIARLDHPGLCAIYDADIDGPTPYIAMRYVEGVPLSAAIAAARDAADSDPARPAPGPPLELPPRSPAALSALLELFERAARALHAAHEAGVVHRDIKPGNVMVTAALDPVILDFGLARDERSDDGLTLSGDVFGTPAYMSPEQLDLGGRALDRRTDVYSLGVALYEALTLRRPFEAPTRAELDRAIRSDPVPDPRAWNPRLPADLRVVLDTALEKERERRYASALELAEDLRRIRVHEPIRARPASVALRLRRWTRRHPVLAVALVLLTSALGLSLYLQAKERRALRFALGRHLAERTTTLLGEDPGAALALGIEAVELAPNYLTRKALFSALQSCYLERSLDGGARMVSDVALAPDGLRLAVAQEDGRTVVWDLARGSIAAELRGSAEVLCARFLPDGARIVTASGDGTAAVWDAATGERIAELDAGPGPVLSAEPSPDGRWIATAAASGAVRVFGADWKTAAAVDLGARSVGSARFSPDGARILLSPAGVPPALSPARSHAPSDPRCPAGDVLCWRWSDASAPARLATSARVRWAELGPGGAEAVVACADGSVRFFDAEHGGESRPPLALEASAGCARFSPDGRRVVATLEDDDDPRAVVVDLATGEHLVLRGHRGRRVVHAAFSPDGARVATASHDLTLRIWDAASGREEHVYKSYFQPQEVEWTPDGRRVVARYTGPVVQVWLAGNRPDAYDLRGHSAAVTSVAFDPAGERALTASDDGTARLWRTPSRAGGEPGELAHVLAGHAAPLTRAQFSRDGARVLTASRDGTARVWDAETGAELGEPLAHASPLVEACFDPAGRSILTVDEAGSARLWSPGGAPRELAGDAPVRAACFSGDGERIATGDDHGRVRLWTSTGELVRTADVATGDRAPRIGLLAFDPGGAELAACDEVSVRFLGVAAGTLSANEIAVVDPREMLYSRDGRFLLAIGKRGGGAVWLQDLHEWHERKPRRMYEIFQLEDLTSARFSPDGTRAMTTSKDGTAYVWELDAGTPFFLADLGQGPLLCSAFSPDGARVITGGADGTARVWPVDPLPAALARKPRELRHWEEAREQRLALPLVYR